MQRTVKATLFTYAVCEIDENGEVKTALRQIEVPETDEKKAYRKAVKQVGNFVSIKSEITETLYKLDDEIFFKYAKKVVKD